MNQIRKENEHSRQQFITLISTIVLILCCFSMLNNKCQPPGSPKTLIKITCREYLLREQQEDRAYGLYSYVLIKREPHDSLERGRYLMLWRAYRGFQKYSEYRTFEVAKEYANVAYWPLKVSSDTQMPDEKRENEMFFIDNYDYTRANIILSQIPEMKTPGPFIVAYHYPLGNMMPQIPEKKEILIVDLSRIDQGLFSDVFDLFQRKVKDDPETWRNKFDWELIRVHFCSALKIHGEYVLDGAVYVAEWIGKHFSGLKAASATP